MPNSKKCCIFGAQFHAGGVCTSSGGVADILKRRLLTLRSDVQKSRKFQKYPQNSATIDVLRDIDYSFVPIDVGTPFAYMCMRTRVPYYVVREYIYIRRGLRVVVLGY